MWFRRFYSRTSSLVRYIFPAAKEMSLVGVMTFLAKLLEPVPLTDTVIVLPLLSVAARPGLQNPTKYTVIQSEESGAIPLYLSPAAS